MPALLDTAIACTLHRYITKEAAELKKRTRLTVAFRGTVHQGTITNE